MKAVIIIAIAFVLLIPSNVDALTITESVVTVHRFENATVAFSYALERAPPDEEFMATIVALTDPEREVLAISTTEKCDYILDVEELSDGPKVVFADCVRDKITIELMNSVNPKDYVGWVLAFFGIGFGVWAYFRKRKDRILEHL